MASSVHPGSTEEADGGQTAEGPRESFVQKLYALGGLLTKNRNVYSMILRDKTSENSLFRSLEFGDEVIHNTMKIIMLVGETGAGKSTHINAMVNYIMGVKWEDKVRVKLVEEETIESQAQSQTTQVNVYKINHMEGFQIPYSLIIIDTPGFGHTGGIKYDKQIVNQISECFASGSGIDHIDVIGFVIKATVTRLTTIESYVIDQVLSILGKDTEHNILFFTTFSGRRKPKVLDILSKASIPCAKFGFGLPIYFKFNNSSIPWRDDDHDDKDNDDDEHDEENEDKGYWKMGLESMEKFFDFLPSLETKSLHLTREVLQERHCLEVTLKGMEAKNEEVMLKLCELEKTENILKQNEAFIESNGDFTYDTKETKVRKVCTDRNATNCHECSSTCHHPCLVGLNPLTYFCEVFYWDATCKICGHDKSKHFSEKHKWETYVESRPITYTELKKKYKEGSSDTVTLARVCEYLREEIQQSQEAGLQFIAQAKRMIRRLHEIALKPELLSMADYIDLLISNEQSNMKPGFQERIISLKKLRKQVIQLHKLSEKENK